MFKASLITHIPGIAIDKEGKETQISQELPQPSIDIHAKCPTTIKDGWYMFYGLNIEVKDGMATIQGVIDVLSNCQPVIPVEEEE